MLCLSLPIFKDNYNLIMYIMYIEKKISQSTNNLNCLKYNYFIIVEIYLNLN